MNRRAFLRVASTVSILGVSGCSAPGTANEDERTHRRIGSSSVRNGVPETIRQTVFVLDVVVKDGRADILTTVSLDLPEESDYKPAGATVSLVVDAVADEWTKQWQGEQLLSGTLSTQIEAGYTVSITSETTFESGGSVQTTRHEEIR